MLPYYHVKDPKRRRSRDDEVNEPKRMRSSSSGFSSSRQETASQPATQKPPPTFSETPNAMSVAVAASSTANPRTSNPPSEFKKSGKIWTGLKKSMGVLEKGSRLCPPLQSALNDVIACLDAVEITAENRDVYEEMASELGTMSESIARYIERLGPEMSNGTVAQIAKLIADEATEINKHQNRGALRRALEPEYEIKHCRRIEALFRQLQADISLRSWNTSESHFKMSLLDRLMPLSDARYNSRYSTTIKRRGCTAETREQVQADLKDWVQDLNGARVYWMNGMAGTGKTTIAYSLCQWLEANSLLGASFFCSRTSSSCSDLNQILPTIAYQLAHYSSAFRSELYKVLENKPDAGQLNVVAQFENLIKGPLVQAQDAMPDVVVIVIDALDECMDDYSVKQMLGVLFRHAASLPLKFFVASRPEPNIQSHMRFPGGSYPSILLLHEIEQSVVEQDIRKYLKEALETLAPPPSEDQIEQLAKPAGKLFIYAATVVRYIMPDEGWGNSEARLSVMLKASEQSSMEIAGRARHAQLDELYKIVLTAAFHGGLQVDELEDMQLVLWTIVCAKEPMTPRMLALLLGLQEQAVISSLRPLESVLHLSAHGVVSTIHASFSDYLLGRSRSGVFAWYCNGAQHNQHLAEQCFKMMTKGLKFNICGLKSSFQLDSEIPDLEERVKRAIDSTLFYACRYWANHLQLSARSDALQRMLSNFLCQQLLFWIEVLNLKGCTGDGERILMQAEAWLLKERILGRTSAHIADARNFITMFVTSACCRSTCHLYLSAVEFFQRASSVHKHFCGRLRGSIKVHGTLVSGRSNVALTRWKVGPKILSVAISHDGTRITSGSVDGVIRVWDAQTGKLAGGEFKGHTEAVYSVAFSPDGAYIVSGSWDRTIQVWIARTGDLAAGPFNGHTDLVTSVAFSPDGKRIVSRSNDSTIRVWDVKTDVSIACLSTGRERSSSSVAFSPDGTCVVSGSDCGTIRVWNLETCNPTAATFNGHVASVSSVAYSPDGAYIVSGSLDSTIRVWHSQTGKPAAGPFKGHKKWVTSVAFSPDGTRIVSGSCDNTIRVWDIQSGNLAAGPFEGHRDPVYSVAYTPDGTRIVSGSGDGTIQMWDTRTSGPHNTAIDESVDVMTSVQFTSDGTSISSGSDDIGMLAWDAQTGSLTPSLSDGPNQSVTSVAFSPDGNYIVSGYDDRTIRVWSARTGKLAAGPFRGRGSWVSSVAFSPDGSRIVSGSDDSTVQVWNAQTGKLAGPFRGHTSRVCSVAFSPDSTRIASGSADGTIQIWDAQTGRNIASSLTGYTSSVKSVAFSPDGTYIVSISNDQTIQVWDAHACDIIAGVFTGSTSSVASATFSPDGTHVIAVFNNLATELWDMHTNNFTPFGLQGPDCPNVDDRTSYSPNRRSMVSITCSDPSQHWVHDTIQVASTGDRGDLPGAATGSWEFNSDGWVTQDNKLLFWAPPELHDFLLRPPVRVRIFPHGSIAVDYSGLLAGDNWAECFIV